MNRALLGSLLISVPLFAAYGCGGSNPPPDDIPSEDNADSGGGSSGGKGPGTGNGGKSGSSGGRSNGGMSGGSSGGRSGSSSGGSPGSVAVSCDGEVDTSLPSVPELALTATVMGKRARLNVQPVSGAVDYRAYVLPADGDIASSDGLTVKDATYRCAGKTISSKGTPVTAIEWPEIKEGETVVVEALDGGCPFQGHMASRAAPKGEFSQPFVTPDQARDETTGELFINGQHDPESRPQPIARGFACLKPGDVAKMDFWEDFSNFDEEPRIVKTSESGGTNYIMETEKFDIQFMLLEQGAYGFGAVDSQLWVAYADWGADVGAKFRLSPKGHRYALSDTTFVHATMAVDSVATFRRYPQIFISTGQFPIQDNLEDSVSINLEAFGDGLLIAEFCDHAYWDVNEQCPVFVNPNVSDDETPRITGKAAVALPSRWDLFVSSQRAYVYFDSEPWACIDLPDGAFKAGDEVGVTFGDVLYHSGADEEINDEPGPSVWQFHSKYQSTETRRVFDDIGFSGAVAEPEWDESEIPCLTRLTSG
jgi:hypothetical protein